MLDEVEKRDEPAREDRRVTAKELPPSLPREDEIRDNERNIYGDCAACGAKYTHVPQCVILIRRNRQQVDEHMKEAVAPLAAAARGETIRESYVVLPSECDREGNCASCGENGGHKPNCPTLARRLSKVKANDHQIGGQHYGLSEFQHWDMVVMFGLDYFQGQITKYVMRWNKKNGLQDLEKAAHFLEKYIEEIKAGRIQRSTP